MVGSVVGKIEDGTVTSNSEVGDEIGNLDVVELDGVVDLLHDLGIVEELLGFSVLLECLYGGGIERSLSTLGRSENDLVTSFSDCFPVKLG